MYTMIGSRAEVAAAGRCGACGASGAVAFKSGPPGWRCLVNFAKRGAAMKKVLVLLVLVVGSLLLFSDPSFSRAHEETSAQTASEATGGGTESIIPPPELRDGIVTLTEGRETDVYEYYVTYYGPEPIEYFEPVGKPDGAVVPVEEIIKKGLAWLADQQQGDGSFQDLNYATKHPNYYPVGLTAFAVLKFEEHAARLGKDPFAADYEYSQNVIDGWTYIFGKGQVIDVKVQTVPAGRNDNPDGDGDGKGIYFVSDVDYKKSPYETGIVMMALQASGHPDDRYGTGSAPELTESYRHIMQDMVDFISWAQQDTPDDWGRGGWRYCAFDNGEPVEATGMVTYEGADNSVSQWPVQGLMAAERWCIFAPDFVKIELETYWLANSQDSSSGCFWYDYRFHLGSWQWYVTNGGHFAVTAAGMIQLTYSGVPTDDDRWIRAGQCIYDNWDNWNVGNLYAMYSLMKAAMTAQPKPIWEFCNGTCHKWQEKYDEWLLANQHADGYWPEKSALPWQPQVRGDWNRVLATEYALLILQKVAPTWDDMHPRKAVDSQGNTIIVFMSNRGGSWEIYYREIEENGNIQDDLLISDDHDCNDSVYPAVALDANNDAHVVWADRRDGNWEIYYSKVLRQGGADKDLTSPDVPISDVDT